MFNNIVAVVVTYNRKELLRQCIDCLLKQEKISCDVLVVDNASTDGTKEVLLKEYKNNQHIKYLNTGKNLGGAGGFEIGIKTALEYGYENVWIMDDDTMPEPSALIELSKADGYLNGEWGFLSSAVYWTNGDLCVANRPKKTLFKHIDEKDLNNRYCKILMGSFVSMLVKSDVIRDLGLPLGEYFIWTDDYEFSGRISRKYPCYFIPNSRVTHAMAVHTRADLATSDECRLQRFRYLYRNDFHCYKQYGFKGYLYLISKIGYGIVTVLAKSKNNKLKRLKTIFRGINEGRKFNPKIHQVNS